MTICTADQIAELLVAEIKEGLDLHSYNGPIVERNTARAVVIKAVTHTQGGTMAMEQVQKSREYGAEMERLVLSHVQKNPDPWYHP